MFLLPSFLTLLNLSAGVAAILFSMNGHAHQACLFVFGGVLLDSLDGWSARLLDCETDFGKVFDSISDFVSFGLAPTFLAVHFKPEHPNPILLICAAFYISCSAFRLIRFHRNGMISSEDGGKYFEGLPITFSGGFLSLQMLVPSHPFEWELLSMTMTILALLMASRILIRKPSLKR